MEEHETLSLPIRIALGRKLHAELVAEAGVDTFGQCMRCFMPWAKTESHTTHYRENDDETGDWVLFPEEE